MRAEAYLGRLITPQPLTSSQGAATAIVVGATIALLMLAIVVYRRPGTSVVAERRAVRAGLLLLALWFAALLFISSLAGQVQEWYAMLFVAPYAILVGVIADRGLAAWRARRRSFALPALAAALALGANHVHDSPLAHGYDSWHVASELTSSTLERFRKKKL